ncbi:MAG: DUF1257 domain-containing protein [Candidatus Sericytochromatia bacterium]|nr:DUF1257 domain-containing protein [Candidatus Sericytochromatia bacterium]
MSHFTRIKTQLNDLEAVEAAVEGLGYPYARNAFVRGYAGNTTQAELVCSPGREYDIGFVQSSGAEISVVADWWGVGKDSGLKQDVFLKSLRQRYAHHLITKQFASQGFQLVQEHCATDQTVKLTFRRWR